MHSSSPENMIANVSEGQLPSNRTPFQDLISETYLNSLVANERQVHEQVMERAALCRTQAVTSLLTYHETSTTAWKTFIASQMKQVDTQINLLRVLLRSLRAHERDCNRDFVLMLGSEMQLPLESEMQLRLDGFKMVRVPPIQRGIPTTDKLHAWRLNNYSRVMFLDADVMLLGSIDEAFTHLDREFTIAAHPYDTVSASRPFTYLTSLVIS